MRLTIRAIVLGALGLSSCLEPRVYPCTDDVQCFLEASAGRCEDPGFCAYPDDSCPSGWIFGPSADEYADTCVPLGGVSATGDTTGSSGNDTTAGSDAADSADTTDGCADGCDTPPGSCFETQGTCDEQLQTCVYPPKPAGTACGGDMDPCFGPGTCDGAGGCGGTPVLCEASPGPCYEAMGTCDSQTGDCEYAPLTMGTPCEDGDGCTLDDACDGSGACVPGAVCPTDDPCEEAACENGTCSFANLPDGASCGGQPKDRCCGGICVDISADASHCGGCGAACANGEGCESVDVTNQCSSAPANTTGRCTCSANADCPGGQICRTFTPYPGRCTPDDVSNCAGTFTDLASCPNYCGY